MTTFAPSVLLGSQRPRVCSVPPAASSAGAEAVELAESAGLFLDPWQRLVLEGSLGEVHGRHAAFEVALIVPRQNGKGSVLESRELAGLFLLDEQLILHSAHEFKTAAEGFRRIMTLIEGCPDLDKQVKKVTRSHGDEGVELRTGQRLRFVARSGGSGRGFSGDCVIFDEAYNLDGRAMGALLPTLSARPNPQLWYASSAGKPESEQLHAVRKRGMAGAPGLAYFEWSAEDDAAHDDPDAWAVANPALGFRITEEFIERERNALPAAEFARERLGIWEDTSGGGVFGPGVWDGCLDVRSQITGPVTFAVEVAEDRSWACIGASGDGPDGLHIETVAYRRGTGWIVEEIVRLTVKHRAAAVVVQPSSPAGSLISALDDRNVRVTRASAQEYAQACGLFHDAVVDGGLRHLGQPELDVSVRGAVKRRSADAWVWDRRAASLDISPLVAVTLAAWGARQKPLRPGRLMVF